MDRLQEKFRSDKQIPWSDMGDYTQKEADKLEETTKHRETKRKFALWIRESSLAIVRRLYKDHNCSSQSEFIEKAVLFYAGYLATESNRDYLPNVLISTLKGIVAESDNRQNRMIFKLAVEVAIVQNVLASIQEVDPISMERLRGECVKEVKRLNGSFCYEDAQTWQRG